jgi:transposase InsO family protein
MAAIPVDPETTTNEVVQRLLQQIIDAKGERAAKAVIVGIVTASGQVISRVSPMTPQDMAFVQKAMNRGVDQIFDRASTPQPAAPPVAPVVPRKERRVLDKLARKAKKPKQTKG